MTEPIVSVSKLAVRYGTVQALSDVSLELLPGRIIGVIGMNGSGKSTLFASIMGTVKIAGGTVQLFGGAGQRPVGETRTTAEMSADAKDAISHRGQAFRAIARIIVAPRAT